MEFQCRVIVQRRCTSCCSSVENIPLQAERHSARRQKPFAFPPESAFTFRPECCSESQRNRVRLQSGIAFTFDRIPQPPFPDRRVPFFSRRTALSTLLLAAFPYCAILLCLLDV